MPPGNITFAVPRVPPPRGVPPPQGVKIPSLGLPVVPGAAPQTPGIPRPAQPAKPTGHDCPQTRMRSGPRVVGTGQTNSGPSTTGRPDDRRPRTPTSPRTRHDGLDLERDWLKATRDRNLSGRPNPFPGLNPFEPARPAGRVCPYKKGPKRHIRKPRGREGHWHSQYRWTDPNPVIEIAHQG